MKKSWFISIKYFVLLVWELPQNIAGMVFLIISHIRRKLIAIQFKDGRYLIETINTGVSMGNFIFYTKKANRFPGRNDCLLHELGHAEQSRMLGPLYLILVGLPSLGRVGYSWYFKKRNRHHWKGYYSGYPENWADRLGGVFKS